VINEHPDVNVRKLYAGEVAARVGLPVADLARQAEQRRRVDVAEPFVAPPAVTSVPEFNAEFVAVALLLQNWDAIAPWLVEELFSSEITRRGFVALATAAERTAGSLFDNAMSLADPDVRELLERAAVADIDVDPPSVAFDLIGVAVRRLLATRTRIVEPTEILADRDARQRLEDITVERTAQEAATALLGWLVDRSMGGDPHE
jgi:DNA primase